MIRKSIRCGLLLAAIALALDAVVGQPATADKIIIREKTGNNKTYEGIIKVGLTGYQIVSPEGKPLATVYPNDIVRVVPGELVGVDRADMLAQISLEDKKTRKENETARLGYTAMLQKAANAPPKTKHYLAFRKALLSTKILDESDDDEWTKQIDPVAKEWDAFLNDYKTGWELWIAARTYARLMTELGKFNEIGTMWKAMGAKEIELPADLKLEAGIQSIDAQLRIGNPAAAALASTAAEALGKSAPGIIARDKLAIYARIGLALNDPTPDKVAAAVKEINEKIAASKEPAVRAVAHSMIGELYLAAKKPRDAMWEFLWVETVHNQDKDEVLKAMIRLKQCFKEQTDEDREKAYQDKIRRFRQQF